MTQAKGPPSLVNPAALKQKQRALRDGFPQPLTLRVHRALSCLMRADAEREDRDIKFILLWIGINAVYAGDVEASAGTNAPEGERALSQAFYVTLVNFDNKHRIYEMSGNASAKRPWANTKEERNAAHMSFVIICTDGTNTVGMPDCGRQRIVLYLASNDICGATGQCILGV